jgi:hypothetical protein
VAKAVILA